MGGFCLVFLPRCYHGSLWIIISPHRLLPLAMNPEEVPSMIVFGAAACFISWLNSSQRRVRKSSRQDPETESGPVGIVVKFILAVLLSVASCLAAAVTASIRSGGSWEYLW